MCVLNPLDAKPGDEVMIGFDEQALVKVSLLVYMLPLMSLILGAIAGQIGAQWLELRLPELLSILGGFSGLLAGLFWVWRTSRRVQMDSRYSARILRTINQVFIEQPR